MNAAAIPATGRAARDRSIVTPEGAALRVRVASIGDRLTALTIDLAVLLALALAGLGAAWGVALAGGPFLATMLWLLAFFALRNFYFTAFEIAWRGATPGKRAVGLRVIDRFGGPLTKEAVFARNFLREVELFLPLSLLIGGVSGGLDGVVNVALIVWVGALLALPFLNRQHLRAGDLVAGTLVIRQPRAVLLADLTDAEPPGAYSFAPGQLEHYGEFELHTLETLLRRPADAAKRQGVDAVFDALTAKVGWSDPVEDREAFLNAYYQALRGHLERRALFGRRKRDKADTGGD